VGQQLLLYTICPVLRRVARACSVPALLLALAGCGAPGPGAAPPPALAAAGCDLAALRTVPLRQAALLSAEPVAAGAYTPPGSSAALPGLPAFCRVLGQAWPSADSLVNFELWLPAAWNGKLVVTGNGGYSPALSLGDMAYALRQGYAALGGDTGHQVADGNDMAWGRGHPEKIIDWGTRSINAITTPGRQLASAVAGQPVRRAYYYGCSTGGHQAYAEVQRYPQDFDGVIAGAPGNNRVALNAEFLWRFRANREPGSDRLILTPAKARLLGERAAAACDALDGVRDGVVDDPRRCTSARFDPAALQCHGADAPDCLTAAQVQAARAIYQGPLNPRTGAQVYPGQVVGTEAGWPTYWGGAQPVRADFWRLWAFDDPRWSAWAFDFDRDLAKARAGVGPLVDQTAVDLRAFQARGGKLITYHGWADPVVSPLDTIAYYEQVRAHQGGQAAADGFFRLFLVPGMDHCRGGPGVSVFGNAGQAAPVITPQTDLLVALDRWVEAGDPPDRLVAARVEQGQVQRSRPLCPYPKQAVYRGSGSTDHESSFDCR